jgi:RNA-binding protein 39
MHEAEREANKYEYTVFVAQIHPKVNERDLFEFFSHVGRVEDIRLIRDQRTQKSKGLCYVEFWEKESVSKAVTLTGQLLGGYPISISITLAPKITTTTVVETSMKLYVGQLHENVTDSDLKPVFEAFGELDFIDIHKDSDGVSKGFGFVQYKSEADARAAMEALNGLKIAGKAIRVGIVDSKSEGASELDDEGTGGVAMNAANRVALMEKLARGTAGLPGLGGGSSMYSQMQPPPPALMAPPPMSVPRIQPSTCVVIKNMFDPKTESDPEFDLDIKEDVEEEATKFGTLKHIFVDKNSMGMVYVRYNDIDGAKQLVSAFNGRWFASRQISADFVPDTTYLMKFPSAR